MERAGKIRFALIAMGLLTAFLQPERVTAQAFEAYTDQIKLTADSVTFTMMPIAGGQYRMGSESGQADEQPVHTVAVDSFWMGQFEVTWEMFELFLKKDLISETHLSEEARLKVDAITRPSPAFEDPSLGMGKEGYPVVNISPYAALTFCKWLSVVTGHFYRLPTEAEWEYACRAGSDKAYHFGDDESLLHEYAVYFDNSNGQYAKVGSKKPNLWGLYDMHGNVSEWTLDLYTPDYYTTQAGKVWENPWNVPYVIHPRVYRGGSWDDDPQDLRSANRMESGLGLQRGDPQVPKSFWWYTNAEFIGFRLVRPYRGMPAPEAKQFWAKVLDE